MGWAVLAECPSDGSQDGRREVNGGEPWEGIEPQLGCKHGPSLHQATACLYIRLLVCVTNTTMACMQSMPGDRVQAVIRKGNHLPEVLGVCELRDQEGSVSQFSSRVAQPASHFKVERELQT